MSSRPAADRKGAGASGPAAKKRGEFIPPGYSTRHEAIAAVIRFGPESLTEAEFKALLWHVERSLFYGKSSDPSSVSQMVEGVFSRSTQEWIRGGCGLKETAVKSANKTLIDRGILKRKYSQTDDGRYLSTRYSIDWKTLNRVFEDFKTSKSKGREVTQVGHDVTPVAKRPVDGSQRDGCTGHDVTIQISSSQSRSEQRRTSAVRNVSTAVALKQPAGAASSQNGIPFPRCDDEKPTTSSEAKAMFRRFLERTAVKNPDRVLGIVERKLNGDYWLEYYAAVREATTTPEAAREGHFVKLAKDAALRVGSGFRRTDVYGMAPQAPERCTKCQAGFRSFEPREYCDCQLGRDLESIARRRAAETCKRCNGTRIIGDPNASPITLCPDCFARDPQQAREISTRVH